MAERTQEETLKLGLTFEGDDPYRPIEEYNKLAGSMFRSLTGRLIRQVRSAEYSVEGNNLVLTVVVVSKVWRAWSWRLFKFVSSTKA